MQFLLLLINLSLPLALAGTGKQYIAISGYDRGTAVTVDSSGRIALAGNRANKYDPRGFSWTRLLSNGTLDPTQLPFPSQVPAVPWGKYSSHAVAIDNKERVYVAGTSAKENEYNFTVARYLPVGTLDTQYNTTGIVTVALEGGIAHSIAQQGNGHEAFLAAGTWNTSNPQGLLVKFTQRGTLDSTFSTDGKLTDPAFSSIYSVTNDEQQHYKWVIAGTSKDKSSSLIARLTTSGELDTTFNTTGRKSLAFGGEAEVVKKVISDGQYYVGGYSYQNKRNEIVITRLETDGKVDPTYGTKVETILGYDDSFVDMVLDQKKRITVLSSSYNGKNWTFGLLRFNSDGELDQSFQSNGKASYLFGSKDAIPSALALRPNGNVCAVGTASPLYNRHWIVACFLEDGNLDPGFGSSAD